MSGHGFWSRSAFPGWGSRCVCVGALRFSLALGVGACGSLRAPRPFPATLAGLPVAWGCAGVAVGGVCPPPPPTSFSGCGGGVFFGPSVSCLVVSSAACPGLGSLGLRPAFPFRLGCAHVFFFCPSLLHLGVRRRVWGVPSSGGPLLSVGCRRVWQGGPSLLPGWGFARLFWSGCVASRLWVCLLPPPPFFRLCCLFVSCLFFLGGVCLFLPLPSLSSCTQWSAFGVADRVAVGVFAWLGRAPVPWVGWVMYTLGLVAFPVGVGSGSAGWAGVPGGFERSWVKGGGVCRVPPPCWCRL